MGKLDPLQEQTMEEILASIRRMISEGDANVTEPRPVTVRTVIGPVRPVGNVARLFSDQDDESGMSEEASPPGNVVELAIAQAMEDAQAEVRADAIAAPLPEADLIAEPETPLTAAAEPAEPAVPHVVVPVQPAPGLAREAPAETHPHPAQAEERRIARPLLSPRTDAAVSNAFNQLATTMLSGSARTIDELVEDLLRPMLRAWLDANLPSLVERLVREEIERVSRGRR